MTELNNCTVQQHPAVLSGHRQLFSHRHTDLMIGKTCEVDR
jgi:hypothetical protein